MNLLAFVTIAGAGTPIDCKYPVLYANQDGHHVTDPAFRAAGYFPVKPYCATIATKASPTCAAVNISDFPTGLPIATTSSAASPVCNDDQICAGTCKTIKHAGEQCANATDYCHKMSGITQCPAENKCPDDKTCGASGTATSISYAIVNGDRIFNSEVSSSAPVFINGMKVHWTDAGMLCTKQVDSGKASSKMHVDDFLQSIAVDDIKTALNVCKKGEIFVSGGKCITLDDNSKSCSATAAATGTAMCATKTCIDSKCVDKDDFNNTSYGLTAFSGALALIGLSLLY